MKTTKRVAAEDREPGLIGRGGAATVLQEQRHLDRSADRVGLERADAVLLPARPRHQTSSGSSAGTSALVVANLSPSCVQEHDLRVGVVGDPFHVLVGRQHGHGQPAGLLLATRVEQAARLGRHGRQRPCPEVPERVQVQVDKGGPGLIGKRVEPVLNRLPILPRTGVRQALIADDRLGDLARLSLQVAVDLLYGELRLGQRGIGLAALRLADQQEQDDRHRDHRHHDDEHEEEPESTSETRISELRAHRGVAAAAGRPLHRGSYNRSFTMRESIPSRLGAIAQLGERLDRTQEVGGSSPPSSTRKSVQWRRLWRFAGDRQSRPPVSVRPVFSNHPAPA